MLKGSKLLPGFFENSIYLDYQSCQYENRCYCNAHSAVDLLFVEYIGVRIAHAPTHQEHTNNDHDGANQHPCVIFFGKNCRVRFVFSHYGKFDGAR